MLKMQNWWEKVNILMSYFKIVGIWIKKKVFKKAHVYPNKGSKQSQ